jgi:hypothetical protein
VARTVSWFPRLPALLRAVNDSVRSHYSGGEIERLFEIQPRSAQMLMRLLPTTSVGKSRLVEREALAGFLSRLEASEDPANEMALIRSEGRPPVVRRKLRELIQRDSVAALTSLPHNLHLETGALAIQFSTVEELATTLWQLAQILEEDLEGFAARYEPASLTDEEETPEEEMERADADHIKEWLAAHA